MVSKADFGRSSGAGLRTLIIALFAALPAGLCLLKLPPAVLAACGTYGYSCTQTACFRVEIWTKQGYTWTWTAGSASVYGQSGTQIDLHVRSTMSSTVTGIEGWSMAIKHMAPTLIGIDEGDFYLKAAQAGSGVSTVQADNPPDYQATKVWTCGQTQAVAIDYGDTGTHHTTGPNSDLVTTTSCYHLKFPNNSSVHQIILDFAEDVGRPSVQNLVVLSGQSVIPCKDKLIINVQSTTSYEATQSYCPFSQMQSTSCDEPAGGGGAVVDPLVMPFSCGDFNADANLDITDAIGILNHLFLGAGTPPLVIINPNPKTEQTQCFNNSELIICPAPAADFHGQDATYKAGYDLVAYSDRYLKREGETYDEAVVVVDHITGLMWAKHPLQNPLDSSDLLHTWPEATAFAAQSNLAGFSGWRLPRITELLSIAHYQISNFGADPAVFSFSAANEGRYWSSETLNQGQIGGTLYVNFAAGHIGRFPSGANLPVRPVREFKASPHQNASTVVKYPFTYGNANGDEDLNITDPIHILRHLFLGETPPCVVTAPVSQGNIPNRDMVDTQGNTITDTVSGLVWHAAPSVELVTWQQALANAENSTHAGEPDWRLPNVQEFATLLDYNAGQPLGGNPAVRAAYLDAFPTDSGRRFWTSTSVFYSGQFHNRAWKVDFTLGLIHDGLFTNEKAPGLGGPHEPARVWIVRGP